MTPSSNGSSDSSTVPQQGTAVLEQMLQGAIQERALSAAGQSILAAALVDIIQGRTMPVQLANYARSQDVTVLTHLARSAPPILANLARDALAAGSSQKDYAAQLAHILRNGTPTPEASGIQRMLQGFGGKA